MKKKIITIFFIIGTILLSFFQEIPVFAGDCPSQTTVSGTKVTFVGELTDTGGDSITYAWFEYGKSESLENKTAEISLTQKGLYCLTISSLSPCTKYYYRAAARNSAGTSYGEIRTFMTTCDSGDFYVEKTVRNLSDGGTWAKEVTADPGEVIEVQIKIRAKEDLTNVRVEDKIPQKTQIMEGSLRIDGEKKEGNISSGVDIGEMEAGEEKRITFQLFLSGSDEFNYGETRLVNEARVMTQNKTISDTATILVKKTGVLGASTAFDVKDFFKFFTLPFICAFITLIVFKPYLIDFDDFLRVKQRELQEKTAQKLLEIQIAKMRKK